MPELDLHLQDTEWPKASIDHDRQVVRAIVVDEAGRFYFMRARRNDEFGEATLIETSGGGVEEGEDLYEAIRRELREELGAEVEILGKIGVVSDYYNLIRRHNINHFYLCKALRFHAPQLTQDEKERFHLSALCLTYEQAVAEYEACAGTKLGRLIANRELPILHRAKEILEKKEEKTMKIETERLILRPFCEEDAQDVFEYLERPTVNCFACMKQDSVEQTREALRERVGQELCLAIVLKDTGKVIGEIEAHAESMAPGPGAVKDTFSPCWMLNPAYQGKGYAFEAARAFFGHLFDHCGARRIYAYTEDYNLTSQRLCEKLGMRREGVFMEFVSFVNNPDGTPLYENTMQYAILKHEWEARK